MDWDGNWMHDTMASQAEGNGAADERHTAVIDIGSGSARAVVMHVNPGGGIEIVAQQRVNLNLMSHVDDEGVLDAAGVASTLDALEDFALIARGYGIRTIHAVGTAALRESGNAAAIVDAAASRFGVPLRLIDGGDEAAYCFIGAIHGLPVSDGTLADIGGGSMEIVRFGARSMLSSVSLPLGSLRIANRFRLTDLPEAEDLRSAYAYVHATLAAAGVSRLSAGESLVGSGGSVRLLSRLDRGREPYPIIKMHGYRVDAGALAEQSRTLAALPRHERAAIDGMNPERSHSIVGGAVVAHALSQYLEAESILVSGQGLREGLARHPGPLLRDAAVGVPPLSSIRAASLADLVARFVPRFSQRGERRAALAGRIGSAVWGNRDGGMTCALRCAAFLLDIGNAIDFYNRLNRTASIIVRTDLPGFTHRESARIAAILLSSEQGRVPPRFRRSRLLPSEDVKIIRQAAVILTLADELESRLPPECPAAAVVAERKGDALRIGTPGWSKVAGPVIEQRWRAAFGEQIHVVRCENDHAASTSGLQDGRTLRAAPG